MTDTGRLEHSSRLGGGRLRLIEEESEQNLVSAGPREGFRQQGVVAVYGNGRLLSKLFVTGSDEGKLSLRVDTGGAEPTETVVLEAGSDDGRGDPRLRPRLLLTDAENPEHQIELGFDGDGPYLMLRSGPSGVLKLSPKRGLELPQFVFLPSAARQAER